MSIDSIISKTQTHIIDLQAYKDSLAPSPPPPPPPSPVGTAIGTYIPPTFAESAFSDTLETVSGLYATGVTSSHDTQLATNPVDAGFYLHDANAPVKWSQIGKPDYFDSTGILFGTSAYTSTQVNAASPHGTEFSVDFNVLSLVKELCGTYPNYGMVIAGNNSNVIMWRSRFASTNTPVLIINGNAIQAERNIWFTTSAAGTMAGNVGFRSAGKTDYGLIRFDLTGYTASQITSAILRMWTYDQYGSQLVSIFRLWNPGDPASIAAPKLGLAAQFSKDANIENHPDVLFVQQAKDANYQSLWMHGTNGDGSSLITPIQLSALGLPTPPGGMNAIACVATAGGQQSLIEAHWTPWRGSKNQQQLKPPKAITHGFLRYYLMITGNPQPAGGKLPGFNGRYCDMRTPDVITLPGMGRGNSGSDDDGLTGGGWRMNHTREPTPGSPTVGRIGVGHGDCYLPDQTGAFGIDMPWDKNYAGQLKKNVWHCIEEEIQMNTVTRPNEKQIRISSITSSNGVATVTLMSPCTSQYWVTGERWTVGGAGAYSQRVYNKTAAITVIDSTHCTYPVPITAPSPAIPGWGPNYPVWLTMCPGEGNFDGVLRGYVDQRLAGEHTGVRFRHSNFVTDGSTQYGIDSAWICIFQGGGANPTTNYAMYLAGIVFAESYIGPMVA